VLLFAKLALVPLVEEELNADGRKDPDFTGRLLN
jgi:hypothetical protein